MRWNEWLNSSWVCSRHSFAPHREHTWQKSPTLHVCLISAVFFSSVFKRIHCYFCCQNGCSEVSHTLRFDFCFSQLKAANLSLNSEEFCCPTGRSVGHLMSSFTLQSKTNDALCYQRQREGQCVGYIWTTVCIDTLINCPAECSEGYLVYWVYFMSLMKHWLPVFSIQLSGS